jgi:hypothetical protein
VLAAAFARQAHDSDTLMPRVDLSSLFPDAAAAYVVDRGGSIRKGTTVTGIAPRGDHVVLRSGYTDESFGDAIVAVGPHQLGHLLGGAIESPEAAHAVACVEQFAYEPIVTAYLKYDRPLGLAQPMQKLAGTPGQWLFDRGQLEGPDGLAAVVISTEQPGARQDHAALLRAIDDQLRRLLPGLPPPAWLKVIAERRRLMRAGRADAPSARHDRSALYLAGDYTDPSSRPRWKRRRGAASQRRASCWPHPELRLLARNRRPARAERALHQYGVDPAIEFATDRCQAADALEAECRVQPDRRGIVRAADHGHHLPVAERRACGDQRGEERAPRTLAHADGIDVDRVFDRVAIPGPRAEGPYAIRRFPRYARQRSHQIRQAALDDVMPSPPDFSSSGAASSNVRCRFRHGARKSR